MTKMEIYLAGAMGGLPFEEYNGWREDFEDSIQEKASFVDQRTYLKVVNPCNYYNFEEKKHKTELEVLKYDLRRVGNSDLVVVNFNKPDSIGTAMELAVAYEKDIPILGINKDNVELHPWLENVCDRMFVTIKDAVDYIIDFYIV